MIWQKLIKNPVLAVGILMFIVFLYELKNPKLWKSYSYRFIPNTCMAIVDRSTNNLPSNWEYDCPDPNFMIITVKEKRTPLTPRELRPMLYKELANSYVILANKSNIETLEQLEKIRINIDHHDLKISSQSTGPDVGKFHKIQDKETINRLLLDFVKVKEL